MKNQFRKELEERESKEMLNIIHNNCINIRRKKTKQAKTNKMLNKILAVLVIIFIGSMVLLLNDDRQEAMNNCMKDYSKNYCERISG